MKKGLKNRLCLLMITLIAVCFTACGVDDIDISEYKDEKIQLVGLEEKTIEVSIADLKAMECVTKKAESTSDKIGVVKATGPLLETLLAQYDKKQEDFSKIIFYGGDDYDIKLNKDFLKENDLILAFGFDGEPLQQDAKPLRLVIPDSDSAYWIRMIEKIEFVK